MRETGTKLAEFCSHALLALEVLIHPRSLSVIDFSSSTNASSDAVNSTFPDVYSYRNKQNTSFSIGTLGKTSDDSNVGDDLYESWLANDDEIETQKDKYYAEKDLETLGDPLAKKIPPLVDSFGIRVPEENRHEIVSAGVGAGPTERNKGKGDESMVESQQFRDPIGGGSAGSQLIGKAVSDFGASDLVEGELATGKNGSEAMAGSFATEGVSAEAALSNPERSKHFAAVGLDSESSMESLPDIVDGDPDSD
ncbi:hypothetical protein U1Q18_015072 [Sarracenia purpurea var. burkii]